MLPSTLQFFIVMFACSINERLQKAVDSEYTGGTLAEVDALAAKHGMKLLSR